VYLDTIAVAPSHQGKGLGTILLKFAENRTRQMGYSDLRLCTNVHMHESQRFYVKRDFIETMRKRVCGYDRIYYRKEVTGEPNASSAKFLHAQKCV